MSVTKISSLFASGGPGFALQSLSSSAPGRSRGAARSTCGSRGSFIGLSQPPFLSAWSGLLAHDQGDIILKGPISQANRSDQGAGRFAELMSSHVVGVVAAGAGWVLAAAPAYFPMSRPMRGTAASTCFFAAGRSFW